MEFNLTEHISPIAVVLVILGGIFATRYFDWWAIPNTLKTLIFGTVFIAVYIIIQKLTGELETADYSKYFLSYAFATSLYELLLKWFMKAVKNKLKGNDKPDTDHPS